VLDECVVVALDELVFELPDEGLPPHAETARAVAASSASSAPDSLRRLTGTAAIASTWLFSA
jgi:hypothetical protein